MLRTGAAASGASQAVLNLILNRETDAFIKREGMYRQNKESMFSKILDQCTDALKAKLKNISTFKLMNSTGDMIGLIKAIRDTSYEFEEQKYPILSIHAALRQFYQEYQRDGESEQAYLEKFQGRTDMLEHVGAQVGQHNAVITFMMRKKGVSAATATIEEMRAIKSEARAAYEAVAFLSGLNKTKYQGMMNDLRNSYLTG